LVFPNGQIYVGQFKNDLEDGIGEYLDLKDDLPNVSSIESKYPEVEDFLRKGCKEIKVEFYNNA